MAASGGDWKAGAFVPSTATVERARAQVDRAFQALQAIRGGATARDATTPQEYQAFLKLHAASRRGARLENARSAGVAAAARLRYETQERARIKRQNARLAGR